MNMCLNLLGMCGGSILSRFELMLDSLSSLLGSLDVTLEELVRNFGEFLFGC